MKEKFIYPVILFSMDLTNVRCSCTADRYKSDFIATGRRVFKDVPIKTAKTRIYLDYAN